MKKFIYLLLAIIAISCSKVPTAIPLPEKNISDTLVLTEHFDTPEKSVYTPVLLSMQSGQWLMNKALLGNTHNDRKNGLQALIVVDNGFASMAFNVNLGTETKIKIFASVYGNTASGKWLVLASNNGGSYVKISDTISTTAKTLEVIEFTYDKPGWTSFAVQKIQGPDTLNFDDFSITTKAPEFNAVYTAPPVYVNNFSTIDPPKTEGAGIDDSNIFLGNPSNAVSNAAASPENYLLTNNYYSSSYSKSRGTPNWVSWHLVKSDYGKVSRTNDYQPNYNLPAGWYRVLFSDYANSSYSRGHNCPSGDRTSSVEANNAVFLMTNIIPQTNENNNTVWNNLEVYTRSLTDAGNECYIIMGSYGNKGTIANGKITVPTNIWKVIVVLPNGNDDLKRISSSTRVIAVNTPNTTTVNSDWKTYRTSVKAIEDATGYKLLSALPENIKQALYTKVDNQ